MRCACSLSAIVRTLHGAYCDSARPHAHFSEPPRASRAIRPAHPRDVSIGPGPFRGCGWRHLGVAVQTVTGVGRQARVRAVA